MSTTATSSLGLDFPEIQNLINDVNSSNAPQELKTRLNSMMGRLQIAAKTGGYSTEFESIKKYIDWIKSVPWGKYTEDSLDLQQVEKLLNEHHYGLQDVKNRVLEYLAVMKLNKQPAITEATTTTETSTTALNTSTNIPPTAIGTEAPVTPVVPATPPANNQESSIEEMKKLRGSSESAPILCFVGIQGVGKTSMAKSIATALGRQFKRVSLGAMGSSTGLRGRSRGEQDAEPGQIVKALCDTGVMNPLILLDEIDKVSGEAGLRADVMAALLEVLDPEQNATFVDHFIDYPISLSQVIFITTANNLGGISTALLDRLEIIRFSSYSPEDKKMIGRNYLLPKVRRATGLTEQQFQIAEEAWDLIISPLGFDAGVRQLERNLQNVARKVAKRIVDGIAPSVTITPENFREFLPQDIEVYS